MKIIYARREWMNIKTLNDLQINKHNIMTIIIIIIITIIKLNRYNTESMIIKNMSMNKNTMITYKKIIINTI